MNNLKTFLIVSYEFYWIFCNINMKMFDSVH